MGIARLCWSGLATAPLIATAACSGGPAVVMSGSSTDAPLATVADQNPDPSIVEVNLEARLAPVELGPGLRPTLLTYNGSLPGPVIRAKVGDRVIAHFKNSLPEPT